MEALLQDLRHAVRSLLRTPGFTVVAILTLAIGIGATTTVFSVVEGVLIRSLPFPNADRLVDIKQVREGGGGGTSPLASYQVWRQGSRTLDEVAAYTGDTPVLTGFGAAERIDAWSVSANFFPLLGTRAYLGRLLLPDEDQPGSEPVVVVSYQFWQSHLGGSAQAIGRTLTLDTVSYTIVGITPPDFQYPATALAWRNLGSKFSGPEGARRAHQWGCWVVARLRPSVSLAQAQAELNAISRHAWSSVPDLDRSLPKLTPLRGYLVAQVRTGILILLGAVLLVLLVACANVASLLLSRGLAREHEVAIRVALGAGRKRIASLILAESLVLSVIGGGLGVLVTVWCVPLLVAAAGPDLPRISEIGVNVPVLAFTLVATIAAGFLAGLPAAVRAGLRPPAGALKKEGAGTTAGAKSRSAAAFVIAQVAGTLLLLAGAGLLGRSFLRLIRLDPGFEPTHVVVASLQLPATRYADLDRRRAFAAEALARIAAMPGVTNAAVASGLPLDGGEVGSVSRPDRPNAKDLPWAWVAAVSPDYFRTLQIPLLRGTSHADPHGIVIDGAAARAYFPGEDPIGRTLAFHGADTRTVVGIVGDTRQESLADAPPPHIYESFDADPPQFLKALVRTAGDPSTIVIPLRNALQSLDHEVPLDQVAPLRDRVANALATERLYTLMLGIFAAAALALAAIGMYGVASYAVTRRTREIGIRRALGADRGDVLSLIVGRGMVLAALGLVPGVVAAAVGTRVLASFLFEVRPLDPTVLGSVGAVLLATAFLASYLPARRATRIDPMVALRAE